MSSPPVITWNSATTPYSAITSLAFTGSGYGGAIPSGTISNVNQVRIYNNFAAASGIADATGCVIAVYDDTVHQGSATSAASVGKYVNAEVNDYNGSTTGADGAYLAIGGLAKHAIPVNSGTIGGAVANYVTVSFKIIVPASATQGNISQGIWLEYNSVA